MWFEYTIFGLFIVTWWWSWRCCKKANAAYAASKKLWTWVQTVHVPMVCAVETHPDCIAAGGEWPPEEVGDFPD